ncbi:MAG: DUF4142 domain-containing protein [Pseudonocardia sp.]|nr:DUF4142 domain-containing protein [Pseudonocardia sp.]
MLRRIPRFLRVSVLAAVLLAISVSVFQSWSAGVPGTGGWYQTQWGPVGPADRDLLVKVRLAGLWEGPTGQQAAQQASSAEVRELGAFIAAQHADLDEAVRQIADKLGVLLPTQASAQQQAWMAEISAATGADYDRLFVQKLREAHGIVLPVINEVRVATRNDLVRTFAELSDAFVTRHIQHLEDSGLVNYEQLPDPPWHGLFSRTRTLGDLIVPILVFTAALFAAVGLVVGMRRRAVAKPVRAIAAPAPGIGPVTALAAIPRSRPAGIGPGGTFALVTESATAEDDPYAGVAVRRDRSPDDRSPDLGEETIDADLEPRDPTTSTGGHRFPPVVAPGESTGPRRARRRTVESTGPRHAAVRR